MTNLMNISVTFQRHVSKVVVLLFGRKKVVPPL